MALLVLIPEAEASAKLCIVILECFIYQTASVSDEAAFYVKEWCNEMFILCNLVLLFG